MTLERRTELGEFLRSRRARLSPDELGLPRDRGQRRVPGLRREELARLAGVSVDHYVRLEQGRSLHFSAAVLDAVARALRLDPLERDHLYRLARPHTDPGPARPERVRPGLLRLLASVPDVPAYIIGRDTDVLAWNDLAAALLTDFGALDPGQRNLARLIVLDEGMRTLYADWPAKLRDVTSYLRFGGARHLDDPKTRALVDELCTASPDFRAAWTAHDIKDKTHGGYAYRHPIVGELELGYETLRLPDDPDQALVVHTVEDGSPSQTALRLLAAWVIEPARPPAR
ncbi:transcriptional regulator with XRE-family HTH domain [Actinoplanes campanulatus]|uniref:Transcriptional regulator with XRE-family HTH domain n=1 Tax=Actinoplanes campanulatus TaxID=113559 RepID=A0A7W5ARZ9_9ACTN|nr:helix-turn-helix transcriptional regulator [Actinoplanes campanulatus]MBB3100774.1 transcriptional regulator with XRE-family HTH domain [Actinoplanes campanulatus]